MNNTTPKTQVVIIGGGFGGAYTAKHLSKLLDPTKAEIILINRTNYFLFTPLLHEVATGGLTPTSVVEPLREVVRGSHVQFIQGEVKSISAEKNTINVSGAKIPYDCLVVSSGAETNFYGVTGAEKYSLTLKNLSDAVTIRNRIIDACEKAAVTQDVEERRRLLSFTIVGGGATGVELAAELIEYLRESLCAYYADRGIKAEDTKVTLIASSPSLIPQFPVALQEAALTELVKKGVEVLLNMQVTSVTAHDVTYHPVATPEATTTLATGALIWVAGVTPVPIEIAGAQYDKGGRIVTDQFLQAVGHRNIWCLGDVSGFVPAGTSARALPMLAQVAVQQSRTVAHNIAATLNNQSQSPFQYHSKGLLISLGQWYAAGTIFGHNFKGPLMWWIWRTVYLFNFHSWRKRGKIIAEWTTNLFYPRDITYLR